MKDPGFSRWRHQPQRESANLLFWPLFFRQKLHEVEKIWTEGEHAFLALPLDPPVNVLIYILIMCENLLYS